MELLILSDTHGTIDSFVLDRVKEVDYVLHAGDIGTINVLDKLKDNAKILKAVWGNIDNQEIREGLNEYEIIEIAGYKVLLIHIAGGVNKYHEKINNLIKCYSCNALVCGHTHILRVHYNKELEILHINPGAAGLHGFHKKRTMLRLTLKKGKISNLFVIERDRESKLI